MISCFSHAEVRKQLFVTRRLNISCFLLNSRQINPPVGQNNRGSCVGAEPVFKEPILIFLPALVRSLRVRLRARCRRLLQLGV